MKPWLTVTCLLLAVALSAGGAWAAERRYVGSRACADCHEEEYGNFTKYAKKAHSYQAVAKMAQGLSATELRDCYGCHTTGYGKPGGFESVEKTPDLAYAGCEVCHGPGSVHIESGDPKDIDTRPSIQLCDTCHTSARVKAFNYRPLRYGGAH